MKITRRDLGVLMIIAGLIIAFLGYKMSFEPTQEEIEKLQDEQQSLKDQIKQLQPYVDAEPKYLKGMEEMKKMVDKIVGKFPDDIIQEDNIVYMVDLLDELKVKVPSFSANPASEVKAVEGAGDFADKRYALKSAHLNFSYEAEDYDVMKELLDYIYKEDGRKINTVTLAFNRETGEISGGIDISAFVLTDGVSEYKPPVLPDDEYGIESGCIFGETEESTEDK